MTVLGDMLARALAERRIPSPVPAAPSTAVDDAVATIPVVVAPAIPQPVLVLAEHPLATPAGLAVLEELRRLDLARVAARAAELAEALADDAAEALELELDDAELLADLHALDLLAALAVDALDLLTGDPAGPTH